jgi:RNA polymerase sigma-70 factor, ECF subfamily
MAGLLETEGEMIREDRIREAMRHLPKTARRLIELYHFEHRPYSEIAQLLDLPEQTVKSRLNRARIALKEHLSHDGEEGPGPAG